MFNKRELIKLTQDLVRISSQNPPGDEKEIAFFIKNLLSKSGLKTELFEFGKNRFSVLAILKGSNSKKSLLITPHLDTVPIGGSWKFPALQAKIYKNKIYGRGATDCKANLAVAIDVLRNFAKENIRLNYDIMFLATADEEAGSLRGLLPILEKKIVKPDYALILDADEFDIIVAQKGLLHIKISVFGKKAHGAYPERGVNAIDIAIDLLNKIKKTKFEYKKHKLLTPPTINIGTIRGGDKVNMVADWCEFELDIRFLPGISGEKIINTIKEIIKTRAKKFRLEVSSLQAPCEINPNHILVRSLKESVRKTIGEYKLKGSQGATVMALLEKYKIPCAATGFGSRGCAHITNEYVKIDNLIKGYKMLREFLFVFDKEVATADKISA